MGGGGEGWVSDDMNLVIPSQRIDPPHPYGLAHVSINAGTSIVNTQEAVGCVRRSQLMCKQFTCACEVHGDAWLLCPAT